MAETTPFDRPDAATEARLDEVREALRLAREARGAGDLLPRRYAAALLSHADDLIKGDPGILDRIAGELDAISASFSSDPKFRALLQSPLVGAKTQWDMLAPALEQAQISVPVRNFLGVIVKNRRAAQLPAILAAFRNELARRRGQEMAEVATAHPLSDSQRTALLASLTRAGHAKVRLHEKVDPSLLGGLVLRLGSRLYDSSIRSKLQRLHAVMKGAA